MSPASTDVLFFGADDRQKLLPRAHMARAPKGHRLAIGFDYRGIISSVIVNVMGIKGGGLGAIGGGSSLNWFATTSPADRAQARQFVDLRPRAATGDRLSRVGLVAPKGLARQAAPLLKRRIRSVYRPQRHHIPPDSQKVDGTHHISQARSPAFPQAETRHRPPRGNRAP